MRGIKPFKLSFLTRPFQWGSAHHLGIAAVAYARLGEPELFTDLEMWTELSEVLGDDLIIDEGIPKSRAEFLVVGNAYQPDGVPAITREVKATVGDLTKSLYVIGDRTWRRGVPTQPVPFTEMSLGWENAYGGEGYDRNPLGKGYVPEDADGDESHPLLNIEIPGQLLTSPKQRPEPAGLGRIDFTWPQRFSLGGTYDKRWLDTRFPGYAEDMDWRIWNMAAPDQQREEPWRGDEQIVVENMHPTKPRLTGRLPGLRARAFVTQHVGAEFPAFHEVDLRLTTVWLFPGVERIVLVYHGAHPITEDDGTDIETLMVAGERIGEPRSIEHYQHVMAKRTGEDRALEALNDKDLVPVDWVGMGPEYDEQAAVTEPEHLLFERQFAVWERENAETRARLEELGLDPDEHGPPKPERPEEPPPLDELGDWLRKKSEEMQKHVEESKTYMEQAQAKARAFYDEIGLDFDDVEAEFEDTPRGPPTFTADGERAFFRKLADEAAEAGSPQEELEWFATHEDPYARFQYQEEQELVAYRAMAHKQRPALPLSEADSRERYDAVFAAARQGQSMAGWDLTGANLAGIDLTGADLRHALLESVCFEGASLHQANLQGAVLAHANLSAANLVQVHLGGANLGRANLRGANVSGSYLVDAILFETDLAGAQLSHCNLQGMTVDQGTWEGTVLRHANLADTTFMEIALPNVDMMGAVMTRATFFKVDVSGLDLSGTNLDDATFFQCRGEEAKFVNASMVGTRTVEGCAFVNADFKGADLTSANLRGTILTGSDLSGARLNKADVSTADLRGAKLYRIVARGSMWQRTNLAGAMMVSADLFESVLEKADLRGADLRGANLYGANFALIHSDEATRVEDSIQDKVRILPQREPPPEPEASA